MAAIDSLLRLIDTQRADGLQVRPGSPPALILGDQERSLSMPPLEAATVVALLEDLLTGEHPSVLRDQGRVTLSYTPDGLGALEVEVLQEGERLSATFRATSGATGGGEQQASALEVGTSPPELHRSVDPESLPARPLSAGEGQLVDLLRRAASRQAADVFLSVGEPATWRLHGDLARLDGVVPTEVELEALFDPVLAPDQRERLARHGSVDLALELEPEGGEAAPRFRVSLFRQARGLAAALRPVARRIPSLQELHLPSSVAELIEYPHGLVLMTGPTGSGKSTTMAALIALLHQTRSRHVITIEDPIEYHYPPGRCLIHQRQVGTHVSGFADGLRAALRSAPDVILLGEMRDPETMAAALTAAETGHLVLSTLHCGNAAMAVDRIIDGFPQARQGQVRLQLSDVLRTVVSQRLVESLSPSTRLPVLEVLHVTHAVAALIREGRSHQIATAIQTGRDQGMVSLERALAERVRAGQVSRSVAQKAANDPEALKALL